MVALYVYFYNNNVISTYIYVIYRNKFKRENDIMQILDMIYKYIFYILPLEQFMMKSVYNNANISRWKLNIYFQNQVCKYPRGSIYLSFFKFGFCVTLFYRFVRESVVNTYSTK